MKTKILGLATLSLLFVAVSCKNETSESVNDSKQVKFKAALGKQTITRVGEFGLDSWEDGNEMAVYSFYQSSTNAFNTFPLEYNDGVWDYDDPVMSTGAYIRYYAWYPQTPTGGVQSANDYTFKYTVKATDDLQEDLIAAYAITNGNVVNLPFKHTLSQVNFGIVKTMGVGIEIRDIKINDVYDTGVYTFTTNSWGTLSNPVNYAYNPRTDPAPVNEPAATNITDGQTTGFRYMGNGGNVNSFENALMLMPQEFDEDSDATVSFTFRLTTWDATGTPVYTPDTNFTSASAYLYDFDTSEWKPGFRYLYLFDFSTYFKTGQISFEVTILDPWKDDTHNTVAETLQATDNTVDAIERAILKHSIANGTTGALAKFPITVSQTVTAEDLEITVIGEFDTGDQINIKFLSAADAEKVKLSDALATIWDKEVVDDVCYLTKGLVMEP